jgi:outer membrane protein assembly factor BamA
MNRSRRITLALVLLFAASGATSAQESKEEKRPLLDVQGNKIFSKQELLSVVNSQLDEWAGHGTKYNTQQLDYCMHQMDFLMKSRGYLQSRSTKKDVEETEAGPRQVLTVIEGPLFRVGDASVEGARLFPSQVVLETLGLRTGDIANGKLISEGLFQRLKTRYGKLGYIQYTAEIVPFFHIKDGAGEGVVDFKITIDEGDQFRIRSIKIAGVDARLTDALARESLLRAGDIYDDELFHESITRMSRTGLVDPIEPERDVEFTENQSKPLVDLVIHVKKPGKLSAGER